MSYNLDKVTKTSTIQGIPGRTELERIPGKIKRTFIDQGYQSEPIIYSDNLARKIQIEVREAFSLPNPEIYQCTEFMIQHTGNEVKRFIMSLVGYYKSSNPILPLQFLVDGILDRNFATVLKKIRTAAYTRRFESYSVEDDLLDKYVPEGYTRMCDIGDVYKYKYWLRWQEPDPEDWLIARTPISEPSDEVKNDWKECLDDILPLRIPFVNPNEILLGLSSSSCRTLKGAPSRVYIEKSHSSENFFSKKPLKGHRTLVYKGPTEFRDCISLPISMSNTVKWIEKQCSVIASKMEHSAYGLSEAEFLSTLDKFWDPSCHYFNRDLAKEGLTKPRWMLKAIQEVFKKKYPELPINEYFSIYNGFTLIFEDGREESFPRGHGLGMANALTTICQAATFEYIIRKGELSGEVSALFYNDDATIKAEDENIIISYAEAEDEILPMLGLMGKNSKTYTSRSMVLCEMYYPKYMNRKESYVKYFSRLPFAATNIVVAKSIYHMVADVTRDQMEPYLFPLCLKFWGYEWDEKEYNLPWWAGGWHRVTFKDVDLTFMHEWEINQLFARGVKVGPPILKPQYFSSVDSTVLWEHPVLQIAPWIKKELNPEVFDIFDVNQPLSVIKAKFHRSLNQEQTYRWFFLQLYNRAQVWMRPAKQEPIENYYLDIIRKYKMTDFIPPWNMYRKVPIERIARLMDREPYPPNQPNKLLGSLCFFSNGAYIHGVIPYPHLPALTHYSLTPDKLIKTNEEILLLPGVSLPEIETEWKSNVAFKQRDYINPNNVHSAWLSVTGDIYNFPEPYYLGGMAEILKPNEDYLFKCDYYGNDVCWDIWCQIGRTLAIPIMFGVFTAEDIDKIFASGEEEKLPPPEEIPDGKEDLDVSDPKIAFWTWRSDKSKYRIPNYLFDIWTSVDSLLSNISTWKMISELSKDPVDQRIEIGMPPEDSGLDLLYKRFTGVEGYSIPPGYYIYRIPNPGGIWENDSDEGLGLWDIDPG